jgi:hypothetical protein
MSRSRRCRLAYFGGRPTLYLFFYNRYDRFIFFFGSTLCEIVPTMRAENKGIIYFCPTTLTNHLAS